MTEAQSAATRFCARVVGPYMIVMGATLLARHESFDVILPAFMQDAPLVLATGALTLIAGLTLLAAHHHWSSPAAIVISLVAVSATLKGASLMAFPDLGATLTAASVRTPGVLVSAALLALLAGLWLSAVGWFAKRPAKR